MWKIINLILIALLIGLFGCRKENSISSAQNEDTTSSEAQSLLWYHTAATLRKEVEPSWIVDVAIVNNYFPVYLKQRKTKLNKAQLYIVANAYKSLGREKAESSIWRLREEGYEDSLFSGPMTSFGFDVTEISTFEKFSNLKSEYFDTLDNYLLNPKTPDK